ASRLIAFLRVRPCVEVLLVAGVFLLLSARGAFADTFLPSSFGAIALPPGDPPGGITANPTTKRVYVVDGGSATSAGTVWLIDANTNQVIKTIATSTAGYKAIA